MLWRCLQTTSDKNSPIQLVFERGETRSMLWRCLRAALNGRTPPRRPQKTLTYLVHIRFKVTKDMRRQRILSQSERMVNARVLILQAWEDFKLHWTLRDNARNDGKTTSATEKRCQAHFNLTSISKHRAVNKKHGDDIHYCDKRHETKMTSLFTAAIASMLLPKKLG